jgi:hypothetical protein
VVVAAWPGGDDTGRGGCAGCDRRGPGAPAAPATAEDGLELAVVTALIVGTFYRSPSPDAVTVEVGTRVAGQTLCIIEAPERIEAEHDGEVVKIYVETGSWCMATACSRSSVPEPPCSRRS